MAQRPPSVWEFVTLGSTMVGCIVGGLVVGLLIDHYARTMPVFTVAGVGVGLVAACLAMYGRVRSFFK